MYRMSYRVFVICMRTVLQAASGVVFQFVPVIDECKDK